ncbi:MAG: hypothetical protein JOS17DRAFT_479278 [Linnemannia elongata]|nr:MAG: hypothetical protein JOS17DRAFT_479278 [Linnemannia elongata]
MSGFFRHLNSRIISSVLCRSLFWPCHCQPRKNCYPLTFPYVFAQNNLTLHLLKSGVSLIATSHFLLSLLPPFCSSSLSFSPFFRLFSLFFLADRFPCRIITFNCINCLSSHPRLRPSPFFLPFLFLLSVLAYRHPTLSRSLPCPPPPHFPLSKTTTLTLSLSFY